MDLDQYFWILIGLYKVGRRGLMKILSDDAAASRDECTPLQWRLDRYVEPSCNIEGNSSSSRPAKLRKSFRAIDQASSARALLCVCERFLVSGGHYGNLFGLFFLRAEKRVSKEATGYMSEFTELAESHFFTLRKLVLTQGACEPKYNSHSAIQNNLGAIQLHIQLSIQGGVHTQPVL